jgi:hypothetical protein
MRLFITLILVVLCACIVGSMSAQQHKIVAPEIPVAIQLITDKSNYRIDDEVYILERISSERAKNEKYISTIHTLSRIAKYDDKEKAILLSWNIKHLIIPSQQVLEGLSDGTLAPHGLQFKYQTAKHVGLEYYCKAKQKGMYFLTSIWSDSKNQIISNPVVITIE